MIGLTERRLKANKRDSRNEAKRRTDVATRTTVRVIKENHQLDEVGNLYHKGEMVLATLMVGKYVTTSEM
jgi:hypothetical protein